MYVNSLVFLAHNQFLLLFFKHAFLCGFKRSISNKEQEFSSAPQQISCANLTCVHSLHKKPFALPKKLLN